MKIILPAVLLATVVGCASQPEDLSAQYTSSSRYEKRDCPALDRELEDIEGRQSVLYASLKEEADADAWQMGVGLVLLWPTLFWLEGGDGVEAMEYQQLLGKQTAIQTAMSRNDC